MENENGKIPRLSLVAVVAFALSLLYTLWLVLGGFNVHFQPLALSDAVYTLIFLSPITVVALAVTAVVQTSRSHGRVRGLWLALAALLVLPLGPAWMLLGLFRWGMRQL